MRPFPFLRGLAPAGWALVAAAVVTAGLIALHGLGLRWDPFDLAGQRLRTAETRADAARTDAAARRFEVAAAAEQARRLDDLHQQTVAVARTSARVATQARSAHDADLPLEPDRARRLAEHDRELCRLAPAVCGAAAADASARGVDALRSRPVAGLAEPGGS